MKPKKKIECVSDFKPYIIKRTKCSVIALIIAFVVNYIPFRAGVSIWLLIALYLIFFLYAYGVCMFLDNIYSHRHLTYDIRKADFDDFLINKGENITATKKLRFAVINPLKKTIKYKTHLKDGQMATYIFYIKENRYERVKKII